MRKTNEEDRNINNPFINLNDENDNTLDFLAALNEASYRRLNKSP